MTTNLLTRYVVIVLAIAAAALCISFNDINFGIDLRGGSVLAYRVERIAGDTEAKEITAEEVDDTITVISQRINKAGTKDVQVRREGENRIVISLPDFSKEQTDEIRERMTQVGELLFGIEAENGDSAYGYTFNLETLNNRRTEELKNGRPFAEPKGFKFYPNRPEREEGESESDYAGRIQTYEKQRRETPWEVKGKWIFFDPEFWDPAHELIHDAENPGFTGRDVLEPTRSRDDKGGNAVSFNIRAERQTVFGIFTKKNVGRQMAIVLNGEIWSSAQILSKLTDNVQIHRGGGGYSEQEQSWLLNCLQSGSLKLRPILESQDEIGASLGNLAVNRGQLAFILGSMAVVIFMLLYYRGLGVIAVLALSMNIYLLFGILMLLQASLTLPGIAGIALTVGMAVDANILIYERIREEIEKGKKLIHAAANGFDRAFVTIFDANLTTFLVAWFLVSYGAGPVKGFGYTMMTGIATTMFCGLFVTKTFVGTAIARGWLTEAKMGQLFQRPNFDFFKLTRPMVTVSLVLMAVGFGAFALTGDSKYGLDFNGGTSLRLAFAAPESEADVADALKRIQNAAGQQKYREIETSAVKPVDGKSTIIEVKLSYSEDDAKADSESAEGADAQARLQKELAGVLGDRLVKPAITNETFVQETRNFTATLNLAEGVAEQQKILDLLARANMKAPAATKIDEAGKVWNVSGTVGVGQREAHQDLVSALAPGDLATASKPIPTIRYLGPNVVADLKVAAFESMIWSLVAILAYIWFRFKELKYGLAATAALVHDVLIALGISVLVNKLGILDTPISLNMIAAFLTIIGYSLNDTIVVFDRIRENLGSIKGTYREICNKAINQTLSRTILTSGTTLLSVAAIFFANLGLESPLEGLSFTLLIGIVVGTYSSIYIASAMLIWLHEREEKKQGKAGAPATVTSAPTQAG